MSAVVAPVGVDPTTGEIPAKRGIAFPDHIRLAHDPMNEDEARKVTHDIKAWAVTLCHLVKKARDGQAWRPLGYPSWGEYVTTEFGFTRQRAQQLIDYAEKIEAIAAAADLATAVVDMMLTERASRAIPAEVLSEAVATAVDALDAGDDVADAVERVVKQTVTESKKVTTEFSPGAPAPSGDPTGGSVPPADSPVDDPADGEDAPEPAPAAAVVGGDRTEASHAAATTVTPDATPAPVPVAPSSPLVPVPDLVPLLALADPSLPNIDVWTYQTMGGDRSAPVDWWSASCGDEQGDGESPLAALLSLCALLDGAA